MQIPVAREVLDQTTRCPHDFQCQKPEGEPCCGGSRMVGGSTLQLNGTTNGRACSYLVGYDGDRFCMCPTRQQIYKQYQR